MKGCYLGAKKDRHKKYELDYYDVVENQGDEIIEDMAKVNLKKYDYYICTPPCNYWSQANYRRETSEYAQKTKLLLPLMYYKLKDTGKPFLIENVYKGCYTKYMEKPTFKHGRHQYWTNIEFEKPEEETGGSADAYEVWKHLNSKTRDGDINVHNVIEKFLEAVNYGL